MPSTKPLIGTLLALALAAPLACHMSDDDDLTESPRSASEAELDGLRYEITTASELSKEQIQSLATFVEAQAEGVSQAKVMVHMGDEGEDATITLELWGADLPGDDLGDELAAEFEFLADAQLAISALDEMAPVEGMPEIDPDDDPETIRQKIIDDLRERGVEGEINVTVTETPEGYEVEVDVEQTEEA